MVLIGKKSAWDSVKNYRLRVKFNNNFPNGLLTISIVKHQNFWSHFWVKLLSNIWSNFWSNFWAKLWSNFWSELLVKNFGRKSNCWSSNCVQKLKFLHSSFKKISSNLEALSHKLVGNSSHMKNIHKTYKNINFQNKKLKSIFEIGQYMRWSFYHFLYRVLNWYSAQHWCNHKSKWHYSLGLGDQKWQNSHSRRCTFDPGL